MVQQCEGFQICVQYYRPWSAGGAWAPASPWAGRPAASWAAGGPPPARPPRGASAAATESSARSVAAVTEVGSIVNVKIQE